MYYIYLHNCIHTHTITVDQYYISIYPHDENFLGTKIGINNDTLVLKVKPDLMKHFFGKAGFALKTRLTNRSSRVMTPLFPQIFQLPISCVGIKSPAIPSGNLT